MLLNFLIESVGKHNEVNLVINGVTRVKYGYLFVPWCSICPREQERKTRTVATETHRLTLHSAHSADAR